jgi:hypothetical protein
LYLERIDGVGPVARACPGDATIVFYADENPAGLIAWAIRYADDCLHELLVIEAAPFLTLELHIQRLALNDKALELFWGHVRSPVSTAAFFQSLTM